MKSKFCYRLLSTTLVVSTLQLDILLTFYNSEWFIGPFPFTDNIIGSYEENIFPLKQWEAVATQHLLESRACRNFSANLAEWDL